MSDQRAVPDLYPALVLKMTSRIDKDIFPYGDVLPKTRLSHPLRSRSAAPFFLTCKIFLAAKLIRLSAARQGTDRIAKVKFHVHHCSS